MSSAPPSTLDVLSHNFNYANALFNKAVQGKCQLGLTDQGRKISQFLIEEGHACKELLVNSQPENTINTELKAITDGLLDNNTSDVQVPSHSACIPISMHRPTSPNLSMINQMCTSPSILGRISPLWMSVLDPSSNPFMVVAYSETDVLQRAFYNNTLQSVDHTNYIKTIRLMFSGAIDWAANELLELVKYAPVPMDGKSASGDVAGDVDNDDLSNVCVALVPGCLMTIPTCGQGSFGVISYVHTVALPLLCPSTQLPLFEEITPELERQWLHASYGDDNINSTNNDNNNLAISQPSTSSELQPPPPSYQNSVLMEGSTTSTNANTTTNQVYTSEDISQFLNEQNSFWRGSTASPNHCIYMFGITHHQRNLAYPDLIFAAVSFATSVAHDQDFFKVISADGPLIILREMLDGLYKTDKITYSQHVSSHMSAKEPSNVIAAIQTSLEMTSERTISEVTRRTLSGGAPFTLSCSKTPNNTNRNNSVIYNWVLTLIPITNKSNPVSISYSHAS